MRQVGDRLVHETWNLVCCRCGGIKIRDQSNSHYIDHQTEDCVFALKERIYGTQLSTWTGSQIAICEELTRTRGELETLKATVSDLHERIKILEMNPLDRLAREAR
jgi:hypothetical protein